ncbi:MAG: hypothetical protein M1824_000793 [Vezdaea acicularis]|nr:MAG: hypothetical protein M1824_000793 [Vezdaea acicularis]
MCIHGLYDHLRPKADHDDDDAIVEIPRHRLQVEEPPEDGRKHPSFGKVPEEPDEPYRISRGVQKQIINLQERRAQGKKNFEAKRKLEETRFGWKKKGAPATRDQAEEGLSGRERST